MGASTAAADPCPNAAYRFGAGANLPDCRAYELVSPADTNSYDINFGNQAVAADGDAVTYQSLGSFAGSPAGSFFNEYLSTRGPAGWSTVGVSPPQNPGVPAPEGSEYEGFASDLSQMVVESDYSSVDGATPGTLDLYLRQPDGSFQLLDPGEPLNVPFGEPPGFQGASSDFSHILFTSVGALTPNAPNDGNFKLYEWADGQIALVSVLPNGQPSDGEAGLTVQPWPHMLSSDGSLAYWTKPGATTTIYLRKVTAGTTTEINAPQCPSPCAANVGATWWTASTDGTEALFTSTDKLTSNSTASDGGTGTGDLYEYDANSGQLTDLTVDTRDPNGADVQGLIGTSADASYIYLVANGALATGATRGHCNPNNGTGSCNLYLLHDGTTTFIASVKESDSADWGGILNAFGSFGLSELAQVSADGLHLLFTSVTPLTSGFDNAGHKEIYLFDATSDALTCVSCAPSGATPASDAVLSAPADVGVGPVSANLQPINNLASDGSVVFFETANPLLPQAVNGTDNVYEWEADGAGSCATTGGCLYLISSGDSPAPSHFLDASPTGGDVFFLTREPLTDQTNGQNLDVYDARVGGGFPAPIPPPAPCQAGACQAPPVAPPPVPVAASVTFYGPGNPTSSVGAASIARVTILRKLVHGTTFVLRVGAPVKGVIKVSGRSVRSARRRLRHAGKFSLRIELTPAAKRALAHKHRIKLRLRITYRPATGGVYSARVVITVVE